MPAVAVMEKVIASDEESAEIFELDDYISPRTEARLLEYLEQKASGTLISRPLAEVAREYGIYS